MSKITLLVGAGAVAILVLSGVIQIQFKPEKISAVPGTFRSVISDGSLLTAGKNKIVTWKRKAELYFADSAINKMELAMKYTEVDTATLMEALEQNKQPEVVISNAELLLQSVDQMREFAGTLSDEELVNLQDQARIITEQTGTALAQLQAVQQDYAEYEERLARVTSSLDNNLEAAQQSDGEVAGSEDAKEESEESTATPTPEIPLRF
ncbi:MAG: hypothetical protein WEC84_02915 [Candidatus Andersenbacteria bacterium]